MIVEEIRQFFKGEVLDSKEALAKYSRDASIFVLQPQLAVCPKDAEDVKALVRFITDKKKEMPDSRLRGNDRSDESLSLTARSAGTDMGGGPLTEGIVIDMARHMNAFVGLDAAAMTATVQPGMFYRDFEKETLAQGLLMPSYPASRELCTVGGMVANNAGGEKTLAYGKTEEYIAALKVVFADGEEHAVRPLTVAELDAKCAQKDFEGELYSRLRKLVDENASLLRRAKPDVSKNSAGYYLWNVWNEDKTIFDLTRLIVGSQGTFGIITEITFRLVRPKPASLMAVVFLKDLALVDEVVSEVLPFYPETFECYDDKTLKLAIRFFPQILVRAHINPVRLAFSFLPDLWMLIRHGWPKLVLMVELTGESEAEIHPRLEALRKALLKYKLPMRLTRHQSGEEKYWVTRRESFSLLRKNVKGKHTAPVVDDFIVKPEHLPKFLPEIEAILAKYSKYLTSTIAGHAGNGNFHIIPLMDFKKPEARAMLRPLMEEVYALVLKYKGSITAEHNDGLVRTPYLEEMYGKEITALFAAAKKAFDPAGIFNPAKKVPVDGRGLDWAMGHMLHE